MLNLPEPLPPYILLPLARRTSSVFHVELQTEQLSYHQVETRRFRRESYYDYLEVL